MRTHDRSITTRVLHLLLLLAVVHQLATSLIMERPYPGDDPVLSFTIHNYVGLATLAIVGGFWLWTVIRQGETRMGRMLPWFSGRRRRDLFVDATAQARRIGRGRAPSDEDGALASAVHGLGLLLITGMAATGTLFFVASGKVAEASITVHALLGNFVYAYIVAHSGLAVIHHLLGSNIFGRMFWPGRRPAVGAGQVSGSATRSM